ncbi:MAG: succinate dehydrogenase cytochrome b subunit [Planctomycetota bacterium]|jgi:succinate dehydrogenase / fumarate reductase cytochrome b subunit
MTRWLQILFNSSIGKKVSMAITGLLLVGFLVAHLAGNLLLYKGDGGAAFDTYAQKLHDLGPLLLVAELGLVGLFGGHVAMGLRTWMENRKARPGRYAVDPGHGGKTFASATMPISGMVILAFLLIHLINFRFDGRFKEGLAERAAGDGSASEGMTGAAGFVAESIATPALAVVYMLGVSALTLHLSHAIASAIQTLGGNHPRWTPILRRVALGLSLVLGLGFFSFPLVALMTWS